MAGRFHHVILPISRGSLYRSARGTRRCVPKGKRRLQWVRARRESLFRPSDPLLPVDRAPVRNSALALVLERRSVEPSACPLIADALSRPFHFFASSSATLADKTGSDPLVFRRATCPRTTAGEKARSPTRSGAARRSRGARRARSTSSYHDASFCHAPVSRYRRSHLPPVRRFVVSSHRPFAHRCAWSEPTRARITIGDARETRAGARKGRVWSGGSRRRSRAGSGDAGESPLFSPLVVSPFSPLSCVPSPRKEVSW